MSETERWWGIGCDEHEMSRTEFMTEEGEDVRKYAFKSVEEAEKAARLQTLVHHAAGLDCVFEAYELNLNEEA